MAFGVPAQNATHGQKRKNETPDRDGSKKQIRKYTKLKSNAFNPAPGKDSRTSRKEDVSLQQRVPQKQRQSPQSTAPGQTLAEKRKHLLPLRAKLPIWPHASNIRAALSGNRHVLVLVGETGSGKSTQVPQFLMSESWCRGAIAVTEPRRVAATTLARRVADEVGTPLGTASPGSKVGYSVRFDPNFSPATKVKYLTEGMLLQELLRDPWLRKYSVVVVDEVHERGVNVDLILGFMRRIVSAQVKEQGKPEKWRKGAGPLKVVVMSATADTEKLFRFFEQSFQAKDSNIARENDISKRTPNGVNSQSTAANGISNGPAGVTKSERGYESDSTWSGISSSAESDDERSRKKSGQITDSSRKARHQSIEGEFCEYISTLYIEGRQHPVETFYAPSPTLDFVEATLKSIFQVHLKEPLPGDILVFLTGQDVVESLESLVNENAEGLEAGVPKILALPLFAALPPAAQQRVFQPAPPRTRKVILATNIAETSVTIPGVRFVIDCGLAKIKEYRSQLGLDSLLVKPISRSAAIQRKGRAGREAPGKCYRLYTEADYLRLDTANTPEILRCDLAMSMLVMKARGVPDVVNFPYLDPPRHDAMRKALAQLHRLGALDDHGEITTTGKQMARLPLPPPLSRVLIASATPTYDCLLDVIDIIASMTVENIFLPLTNNDNIAGETRTAASNGNTGGDSNDQDDDKADTAREETESLRRDLSNRQGDHLTFLATVQAYAAENTNRKAWCAKYRVSHRAMKAVMDVRKQLREQCKLQGLLLSPPSSSPSDTRDRTKERDNTATAETKEKEKERDPNAALKAFLAPYSSNLAVLHPDGSYKTLVGRQLVAVHPSSVLFGRPRKAELILYNELVYTSKCYARRVSAVEWGWLEEAVAEMGTEMGILGGGGHGVSGVERAGGR